MDVFSKRMKDAVETYKGEPNDANLKALTDLTGEVEKAEKEAAENAKKNAPPEKYELQSPEGDHTAPEDVEEVKAHAKKLGLNNEAAQALLKRDDDIRRKYRERMATLEKQRIAGLVKEVEKRWPGDRSAATLAKAKLITDHFASDAYRDHLAKTGEGNEPEFLAMLEKMHDELKLGDGRIPKPGASESKSTKEQDVKKEMADWGMPNPIK